MVWRQAKLDSRRVFVLLKNDALFKSGQKWLKKNSSRFGCLNPSLTLKSARLVNNEFENIVEESAKQRANQGRDGFVMDAVSNDIKAFAEGGSENMKYLREMYPDGAPYQLWRDYLEKLRGLPTEYFEAKVQRGVDLNEFAGAVVPKGTSQELINKLEKKGLEVITYPKGDKMARAEAVKSISGKRSDIAFMPEGKTKEEEPIDWTAFTQKTEKPLSTIRAYAVPQQQKDESY